MVHSDFCLKAGKHLDEDMYTVDQYLSFEQIFKWKLVIFIYLIYTSSFYSSNSITMKRPSADSFHPLHEKYIDLLSPIKADHDYFHFNPGTTSEADGNQWENRTLQASSSTEALQFDYDGQNDISLSYTPLLPVSFLVEMIPYPRLYPGRSFFFSRLDNLNRIRLAIGLNQWGKTGECMELWIHHELFYSLEPTPKISTYYIGSGLVNHAGLVIVPLPNYQFNTNKPITLIIEITNASVKVYKNCKLYHKPLFSINYRQNIKYHHLHGDRFENKSKELSRLDKFYALSGGPYHGDKFLGLMKRMKMFFTEYGARKYCSDDSNFKLCKSSLNEQHIRKEWGKLNPFNQSNHTVQLNNNEQISGKINQQLNNNIYNRTEQSFNNKNDVTVKNGLKLNKCNQNIHEDNCTKLNLNKSVNNVPGGRPALTEVVGAEGDVSGDASTGTHSVSHMDRVDSGGENVLGTQVPGGRPALTEVVGAEGDVSGDASTGTHSVSHMDRVDSGGENVLGTQVPGGRPALTEVVGAEGDVSGDASTGTHSVSRMDRVDSGGENVLGTQVPGGRPALTEVVGAEGDVSGDASTGTHSVSHMDRVDSGGENVLGTQVPGGRPALTEVVGAEGDVSGDASTGTHSVSHMDRVDSGGENVLGTQVPGGRPALTEVVGAEGDVSGDASTGTHSVSHMDRVDSGGENVLGTQVPGGRPALTEVVGAEGDVSGDASTGTHSVSHMDRVDSGGENVLGTQVPGGRPALTEVVGAEGDVSGDASTGTHSVSRMDRVDSGGENVLGTQVPVGRPALTEVVGAEGDVSGDASTGTHSVSHMDRVDSGGENVLGTQVPGGRPALTEVVGAEGDVSGDASTGTHSVSHMDRVDSGGENVLGTQVPGGRPALTEVVGAEGDVSGDASTGTHSVSRMDRVDSGGENVLGTQVPDGRPALTEVVGAEGDVSGDASTGTHSVSRMDRVDSGGENVLGTQVPGGRPALTEVVGAEGDVSGDASTGTHSVSRMDRVDSGGENVLGTQVSSEQPASTSERQTGDNETRDTSGYSDSISHMGVGVGVGASANASEENVLDTQVSSEQPASTSERQTGDNETRDTSGDSDSISHMGVGVGFGATASASASEENVLDTQVSSEQPASTSERQTGDIETRDTSGYSDSIKHMGVGVGVGVGASANASEENVLDTQVSSEQPASTSERQTGDNETRDTSGDSDSISHMGVGVGFGATASASASEENVLDTQVSSEQPASTSERQTGDIETRDTSGYSDSIKHMGVGVGVGVGASANASEENVLDTQVSSEQPASTSERQTGDNETRVTSGDSDSISHMGVGVGFGATASASASEENVLDTQVSSEQPASTSERQTGDNETRVTSGDSDSISHMGVGVGFGATASASASEENVLDTQVSSEQPASTSERQTGDNETRDTSGYSDSISHMGVGVGFGATASASASEENVLDTQVSSEQPASTSERQTGDNETRDTSGYSDSISHMGVGVGFGATASASASEENVLDTQGQKGDIGPQGPAGLVGSTGYCPETICPSIDMSSLKGVQGETGSSEWCNRSCKTIDGIIGLKGIKGLKGDMGDTLILSYSKALQLIKYTVNITSSNYFPKGQKGDKGEVIQRKFIQRRISSQNNRNFHRRKRGQQQDYDHLTSRIHPLQENKKHLKHPLNQTTHDSSVLFTGSNFPNLEKQKVLGVKILHNPNEFKTIGSILPVGALVVTEFFNYEVLSFANDNQSSKWDLNKKFQLDQLSSLGLFMKIENIHNTWKRIHVKFGQEVTFGQHDPNLQIYNSSSSKEPSSKTYTLRYREKIVFAFHPVPLTGGSFSGWHGANTKCHETALHHLGIPGFKVLLVDTNFPIERLIKWQYQHVPIINLGSQTVFSKWRDFLYGIRSNINVPLYDLYGMPDLQVHSKNFWLGGGITFGCDGWTTNSSTKFGLTWSFDHRIGQLKINYAKCDSINYLMCYKIVKSTLA
ncbi:unnamed protein product [Schistosoma margrebowiei]|uniref:Uncharacterized protein n=1 Tax=Schistosoma margrebowiei TaxID=48269 RepID=A0AA85AP16_9TREM|nr:unnamed protein product [Schistosoma margrebowiei]